MTDTEQAETERVVADLAGDDLRILDVIAENGGEADTSEIAAVTKLDPPQVEYHVERLSTDRDAGPNWEDEGLVELSVPDSSGAEHRPSKRVALTGRGAAFVDSVDTDAYLSGRTEADLDRLRDAVSRIEARVGEIVNAMGETPREEDGDAESPVQSTTENEIRQLTNRVARLERRVGSVEDTVDAIQRYLRSNNVSLSKYRDEDRNVDE